MRIIEPGRRRLSRSEAHAQLLASVGEHAPLLMSREEAARVLGGLHVQTIGKLARAGKLERVFIGRRSMITVASVRALAAGRSSSPWAGGGKLAAVAETAP
jgi:hypothetical protein